ncbi:MAG: Ser-Thr-rich glycosyl-phosphatidyl-inositol-anchored rane family [Candidatus Parcubacteria bacterium]|jgi:hypothetical protein
MIKRIAIGVLLLTVVITPFALRAQKVPPVHLLENLNKEQLIQVIKCLVSPIGDLKKCIDKVAPQPKPIVIIQYPNGGETLIEGQPVTITWIASSTPNASSTVDLSLVSDEARKDTSIAKSIFNAGSYTWTPKASTGYQSNYRIAIKLNTGFELTSDMSDKTFKIQPATSTATSTSPMGQLETKIAPIPTNNQVFTTQTSGVYGLDVTAKNNALTVETLDLRVLSQMASSVPEVVGPSENPGVVINKIYVYADETLLLTLPVNVSTFSKNTSGEYYVRLAGLNLKLNKDTTKRIFIKVDSNSRDYPRKVTFGGGTTSQLRAVHGNGISTYHQLTSTLFERVHTFAATLR